MTNTSLILLFGKLKSLSPKGQLEVETENEMTPQTLREAVAKALAQNNPQFGGVKELSSSAIANETRILSEKESIGDGKEFSLLPPVCGG